MGGAPSTKRAPFDPNLGQPQRVPPRPTSRQMQQQAFLRGGGGRGWNMGGPLYAAQGEPIIDDTEVLKQMIIDALSQEAVIDQVDPFEQQSESQRFWRYKGLPGFADDVAANARTISERISDEELRNEMRMLEREEPSEARQRALDELMEYRNR